MSEHAECCPSGKLVAPGGGGDERGDPVGRKGGSSRTGTTSKTVTTEIGKVTVDVPRDRAGMFTPQVVTKHRRRLDGFDQARRSRGTLPSRATCSWSSPRPIA